MRICLICTEIFAWGKYGGFGRATRIIGRELARRGVEVFAVVPQRLDQGAVEQLDGIKVLGFPPSRPLRMLRLFRDVDADIYHSCEPSLGTWLAQRAAPSKRHMITFRDPRDLKDWVMELRRPSLRRVQVIGNWLYESGPPVGTAVRRADALYASAEHLLPKVEKLFGLTHRPRFLPTPVPVPPESQKAEHPLVCYLARLDRRKRPELFLDLVARFPKARFVALGKSRDPTYERRLHAAYGHLPNLEFIGFVDQFDSDLHSRLLGASWIMVNTATREALPNAFLEAAAHGCAILSKVDHDSFVSRFGHHAADGDFAGGLASLLEGDRWRERGRLGREHIQAVFALDHAMDLHLAAYDSLLGQRRAGHRAATARLEPALPRDSGRS